MQKTIYIATPEIWESIKAMTNGKSISRYLVDLHTDNVLRSQVAADRQATIDREIELVDSIEKIDDFSE
jgi:hypothetical protein